MFKNEAEWLERQLSLLPVEKLSPLLSLGSGGASLRNDKQPWIAERVYAPLEARGVRVVHHEYAPGAGVDVAGDLADPGFLDSLSALDTRAVMCCNLLEHLADREPLRKAFGALVAPGSYLVLTVPHHFPYHADPIDTLYRPAVQDLTEVLPGFSLVAGEDLATGTLWKYLRDTPDARTSVMTGLRSAIRRPGRRARSAGAPSATTECARPSGGGSARYFFRTTSVTCAIYQRTPVGDE